MTKVFCPFCLTIHDFGEPPICSDRTDPDGKNPDVPRSYIQNYEINRPLWLAAIGFSQHGKTSFIGGLSSVLENSEKFWEGTTISYSDQYTFQTIQKIRKLIRERKADKPTRPSWETSDNDDKLNKPDRTQVPRPLLIQMDSIPKFKSRCLVVYDTAGEYFNTLTGISDEASQIGYLKSLKAVRNLWFMISLDDLANSKNSERQNIRDLLNIYIVGMQSMGWDIRGNNLIVVYTKGDKFKDNEYIPEPIREYLVSDPYGQVVRQVTHAGRDNFFQGVQRVNFNMDAYLDKMIEISALLCEYTKKLPYGSAFLNLAEKHQLKVCFTITSALGTDLTDGEAFVDITSYRVLDPLLWALKLADEQGDIQHTTIKLILDTNPGSMESPSIYSLDLERLVHSLGKIGDEVVVYYLGRTKPCAEPGQKLPSGVPGQKFPRLLKPLLMENARNSLAIVLTTGPMLDLEDFLVEDSFLNSTWKNRLLIVSFSEGYEPNWKSSVTFREGEQVEFIFNQFKKMLQSQA